MRASLARRAGIDGNPLRRGSDRAESWIRIVLLLVFLVVTPIVTVGLGRWTAASTEADARAQAAAVHPVSATVKRTVPTTAPNAGGSALTWAPARWTAPDGSTRTGQIQAPPGTRAGSTVRIWVDDAGKASQPPLTHAQVISRVVTVVALAPAVVALALAFAFGLLHRLLERRRLRAWEAAWSAVEPFWTKRLR